MTIDRQGNGRIAGRERREGMERREGRGGREGKDAASRDEAMYEVGEVARDCSTSAAGNAPAEFAILFDPCITGQEKLEELLEPFGFYGFYIPRYSSDRVMFARYEGTSKNEELAGIVLELEGVLEFRTAYRRECYGKDSSKDERTGDYRNRD